MKNILVTLKDSHIIDGEKESYEITTHGAWDGEEDNYTIEYDEQYDELRGCHTKITVTNGSCVSVVRTGAFSSEMTIEKDKRHDCEYNTPYGAMIISIHAINIKSDIIDGKGTLEMKYTINFYGNATSMNEMIITIE